ncbi:hypothetical protein KL911_001074 [Ogataea haglerorum]|uniref:Uncharacterized protein n=1 Tax=Ogataea haglerorum TaxID=1937702 RepID=A0ABQ7RDY1_9ASCO|nr:uncharacterized protein KL911_001074 [Ogataea haglerorum]KAG7709445.1 hypothetical protein KL914_001835 [Ogataea haglerorum]KAG7758098.1 hypothetical protein KL911_001074 [Ogataea haglerorum]KAG7763958.1 hypothetical protein KL946_003398 [Ogataea haglerorum]KAG7804312.1 hypothetical protein KL944_000058 [Ogataea haglerorum]KAG7808128.1 hypothetical protein KL924_003811 [Ogataea haglerorum]
MLGATISQPAQQTVQISAAQAHKRYDNWRITRSRAGNCAQIRRQRDGLRFGPGNIRSARAAGHEKCAFSPVQRGGPGVAGNRAKHCLQPRRPIRRRDLQRRCPPDQTDSTSATGRATRTFRYQLLRQRSARTARSETP